MTNHVMSFLHTQRVSCEVLRRFTKTTDEKYGITTLFKGIDVKGKHCHTEHLGILHKSKFNYGF